MFFAIKCHRHCKQHHITHNTHRHQTQYDGKKIEQHALKPCEKRVRRLHHIEHFLIHEPYEEEQDEGKIAGEWLAMTTSLHMHNERCNPAIVVMMRSKYHLDYLGQGKRSCICEALPRGRSEREDNG